MKIMLQKVALLKKNNLGIVIVFSGLQIAISTNPAKCVPGIHLA